jgi:hypothetical protein
MKCTDDLVLLVKKQAVLQGMIYRLTEIGRSCGMEMHVGKTKVMTISREPSPLQIMIGQKQLENLEYFYYLGTMITYYARCTGEIKARTAKP